MTEYYLDWAATTKMSETALQTYVETAAGYFGNPSSIHSPGKAANTRLGTIRKGFSSILRVKKEHLYFTSGGTESNEMICDFFLRKKRNLHIILSGIEHPAIYEYYTAFVQSGHDVTVLPTPGGVIDPELLAANLRKETALILCMTVNNVLGTIQPLKEIRKVIDDYAYRNRTSIHLHADSVQAFGKLPIGSYMPYVDSAAFSAHKLQGPKGCGILYCRKPITVLSPGGGQESGLRPGTEDLPSLAAFLTAAQQYQDRLRENYDLMQSLSARMAELLMETGFFSLPDISEERSPFIFPVVVNNLPAEVATRVLNDHGLYVSTGSACSSKSRKKMQRVLIQSGIDSKAADSLIRLSFGPDLTVQDIDTVAARMIEVIGNVLRQMGRLR